MNNRFKISGFTLVEMSIVLVIIGLIIGGVLVGRDLINGSEIRATISQFEKYNTSVNTFRSKYNCLPGDCATATDVGMTTNGDGDGYIGQCSSKSTCRYPTDKSGENIAFWQHLTSAALMKDAIGVTTLGGPASAMPPQSSIGGLDVLSEAPFDSMFGGGEFKAHSFLLNGGTITTNNMFRVYHPAKIQAVDSKIDDGIPVSGNVKAFTVFSVSFLGGTTGRYIFGQTLYSGGSLISLGSGIGAGGAANVCVRSDTTPYSYNINPSSITSATGGCGFVVKAAF